MTGSEPSELSISQFEEHHRAGLVALWKACALTRPWNNPDADIDRNLAHGLALLVAVVDETVVGSVMVGYDGHRGWVNYLAVAPSQRGSGLGRQLMNSAEEALLGVGCPKVNLQVRAGNDGAIAFYESIGYELELAQSMGRRLIED